MTPPNLEREIVRLGQDPMIRSVLRRLFEQHPEVAGFESLKHDLSLDDTFSETTLRPLVSTRILEMSESGYQLSGAAFDILQGHPGLIT